MTNAISGDENLDTITLYAKWETPEIPVIDECSG
jgi:hypothetical protein